jgi:hypothetical protein
MKRLVTAFALTTLLASPAFAHPRYDFDHYPPPAQFTTPHHPGRFVNRFVLPSHGRQPAGTTWHDYAKYGQPPMRTGTWARSQDGENTVPVDTYDVVVNGAIVGRDPDPNIRFQLMREAMQPGE